MSLLTMLKKLNLLLTLKVLITLFWIFFLLIVAATSLPHNVLSPTLNTRNNLQTLFPQKWGFFTKNPQDVDVFVYSRKEKQWSSLLYTPNSSLRNLFGLNRRSRSQGSEYGILIHQLTKDSVKWMECRDMNHFQCFESNLNIKSIVIHNSVQNPSLCGEVYIAMQKPLPWAWSKSQNKINMPILFLKLDIRCE